MPRVTRKSIVDSPEPTRRSSRAATQASSTSSKATPPPSRSRSKSVKKAGSEAGDGPEEIEEVKKPTGRGRSQSKKKVEDVESPAPRGTKRKAPSTSPKQTKGKGRGTAKRGKVDVELEDEPEEEEAVTEEPVEEAEPEESRGRSRKKGKTTASPKVTEKVATSSSSRGHKGKKTPAATPSPAKSSPRNQRGRKSEPTDVEQKEDADITDPIGADPVKASPVKTTPVKASPAKTTPVKPTSVAASPVKSGATPVVEPITPESEPEMSAIENISPAEPKPPVSIPVVATEARQTPGGGTKRKARDDDEQDVSVKRPHVSSAHGSSETVSSQKDKVDASSQSTKITSQSSEAAAKPDPTDDFEIISHNDVPAADSQEVQQCVPATQTKSTKPQVVSSPSKKVTPAPKVTTSEAVSSQSEAGSSAKQVSSGGCNTPVYFVVVSGQSGSVEVKSSTDSISTVDSSVDIGCYGDDRTPLPPKPSTAKTNITSQSSLSNVNHRAADSNQKEATSNKNSTNSINSQPATQSNQSENVTSSNTTNGVSHLEKPKVSPIKHFDPKPTPTSAFLTKYSKDIFNRNYLTNPALSNPVDSTRQFSLVSYNILADCHLQRGDYSYTSDQYLNQNYRHELLLRELKYLNADVICLQEVNPEYFSAILKPALQSLGYAGDLHKRCKEYFNEGEATFYKTSRFTMLEQKGLNLKDLAEREVMAGGLNEDVQTAVREYLDRADVLHLSRLQCNNTGKIVTIGNIHVIWDEFKSPDVQCIQIASAIKEIVNKAGNDTSPFIITGDFNSEISSSGYQLGRDGYLSDVNIQKLQSLENLQTKEGSKSLVNHLWRAFQHTASNLRSAYFTVQGQEPVVTSYTANMKTTVDYIFYNANSLDVNGTLQVVHHDVINKTGGLPSAEFPSDHVSLKAVFNLKP
ncbi:hypothetical protein LOTGIDRAFT_233228 [Lottia gigantea]|uniref:Endonuclease/exonuclease/phosphatase domain-containing protein n=1 Tax=Lottia gigantea TaxID=225164 RepID=V4AAS0_LOTGI|nr:hypothetical protein LOTGIDRAFT_233228 [Lottia gigantea]ESO92200.1 hypothetical protein LOTGIDRAFT_233228 [Lottia gigantea]